MSFEEDNKVTYFGETDARNRQVRFGIKREDRSRHMYVIGKTGMGKSTLLENMAIQDIQNGEGLAFMDPHGKTAELLLEYIPEHRIKDVVYFAPFDMEYPVAFNVMEDIGADRRHLVASGLMSAFKKIWVDAWSARMEYILNNIMLALLEYPGSTLLGVNRMLADKEFRNKVVANITDPSVRSFWVDEYAKYTDKFAAEAAPAIQNKVGQFVANPLVRNIIGQAKSSFDIRKMMDEKKILIINLSKGRIGESNANLLGSMLVTKIYLAAMSRADLNEKEMAKAAPFYLYVDEFQSFANESFADILSEARKYKLNLTIAHQYIEQMPEEVRSAVFGNVGTMITFRVGAIDAEVLEKEFAPIFVQEDIVNLGRFQSYMKLMIDGVTSAPFSARGMAPIDRPEISFRDKIVESSRAQFSHSRTQVEQEIKDWHLERADGGQGGSSTGSGGSGSGNAGFSGGNGGQRRDYKPSGNGSGSNGGNGGNSAGFNGSPRNNDNRSGGNGNRSDAPRPSNDRPQIDRPPRSEDRPQPSQSQNQPPKKSGPSPLLAEAIKQARIEREDADKRKADDKQKKVEIENDLRSAISLSYLQGNNNSAKKEQHQRSEKSAKPENVAALRDVIINATADKPVQPPKPEQPQQIQQQPRPIQEPAQPAQETPKHHPYPGSMHATAAPKPQPEVQSPIQQKNIREVPESVLKDILGIE